MMFQKAIVVSAVGLAGLGAFSTFGNSVHLAIAGKTQSQATYVHSTQVLPPAVGSQRQAVLRSALSLVEELADAALTGRRVADGLYNVKQVVNLDGVEDAARGYRFRFEGSNVFLESPAANDRGAMTVHATIEQRPRTAELLLSHMEQDGPIHVGFSDAGEPVLESTHRGELLRTTFASNDSPSTRAIHDAEDGRFIGGSVLFDDVHRTDFPDWANIQNYFTPALRGRNAAFHMSLDGLPEGISFGGAAAEDLFAILKRSDELDYYGDGMLLFRNTTEGASNPSGQTETKVVRAENGKLHVETNGMVYDNQDSSVLRVYGGDNSANLERVRFEGPGLLGPQSLDVIRGAEDGRFHVGSSADPRFAYSFPRNRAGRHTGNTLLPLLRNTESTSLPWAEFHADGRVVLPGGVTQHLPDPSKKTWNLGWNGRFDRPSAGVN